MQLVIARGFAAILAAMGRADGVGVVGKTAVSHGFEPNATAIPPKLLVETGARTPDELPPGSLALASPARGLEVMRDVPNRRPWSPGRPAALTVLLAVALGFSLAGTTPSLAAGKLSWLDDVVREVVREAEAGGKVVARGSDGATTALCGSGRLFGREADESLEVLVKRSDDLAHAGRRAETVGEAVLQKRFTRLIPHDPDNVRAFTALAPAEKRLVVEMGETAQRLARRYPGQAEEMIRSLGTEGMSAVRVFGDDVAEVIVKEGPSSLGVLRKTGRGGWGFFTQQVLPHKKKLLAAGVLTAFLADPDRFVDYAGRATEYAVREFGRAGVQLAGAIGGGAAKGLEASVAEVLSRYGLNFAVTRWLGIALAGGVVLIASMVVLGLPVRWMLRPILWPLRLLTWKAARRRGALEARPQ